MSASISTREALAEPEFIRVKRAAISPAYPTYAKAADPAPRKPDHGPPTNCACQLEDAKGLLAEAFEELKKVELLGGRNAIRRANARRERARSSA